jgi:hypothetical protein
MLPSLTALKGVEGDLEKENWQGWWSGIRVASAVHLAFCQFIDVSTICVCS